jgi:hypothetical protein
VPGGSERKETAVVCAVYPLDNSGFFTYAVVIFWRRQAGLSVYLLMTPEFLHGTLHIHKDRWRRNEKYTEVLKISLNNFHSGVKLDVIILCMGVLEYHATLSRKSNRRIL